MKILLDYVFPITVITPTPAASTGFLKQACVVAKPKSGQEGNVGTIYECANMAAVSARTDDASAQQLFNAGMSKVYVLLANDLDLDTFLAGGDGSNFYTLLISDDFTMTNIEAMDVGTWDGVIGISGTDTTKLATQAAIENRVAFFTSASNGSKNMFYAFGKLLSNPSNWLNQQYIAMPFDDGVGTLADANSRFDSKVSFVLNDDEFGNRLALFAAGGKAIVAPYILKNLRIDLQSSALTWMSANQPSYTKKEASLLETRLQEDVINSKYIGLNWIESGTVEISLVEDNFVANGTINVTEPKALWRVFNEMRQAI